MQSFLENEPLNKGNGSSRHVTVAMTGSKITREKRKSADGA